MGQHISNLKKRHYRIRSKITGTSDRPRLAVSRSNKYIYAQLINDELGVTIVGCSSKYVVSNKETKALSAKIVGQELAKKASEKGIKNVVFDRGGYRYHGRVKSLADGARESGLVF